MCPSRRRSGSADARPDALAHSSPWHAVHYTSKRSSHDRFRSAVRRWHASVPSHQVAASQLGADRSLCSRRKRARPGPRDRGRGRRRRRNVHDPWPLATAATPSTSSTSDASSHSPPCPGCSRTRPARGLRPPKGGPALRAGPAPVVRVCGAGGRRHRPDARTPSQAVDRQVLWYGSPGRYSCHCCGVRLRRTCAHT